MKVEVNGVKNGQETHHSYTLIDYYDDGRKVTAMGRTTAYTASAVIQLLARGEIKGVGIVPPERLGMDGKCFERIMEELEKDGIKVKRLTDLK
jgi:lysine 6-dehydrogenase